MAGVSRSSSADVARSPISRANSNLRPVCHRERRTTLSPRPASPRGGGGGGGSGKRGPARAGHPPSTPGATPAISVRRALEMAVPLRPVRLRSSRAASNALPPGRRPVPAETQEVPQVGGVPGIGRMSQPAGLVLQFCERQAFLRRPGRQFDRCLLRGLGREHDEAVEHRVRNVTWIPRPTVLRTSVFAP